MENAFYPIYYRNNLAEVATHLKPGDIFVYKSHRSSSMISWTQKIFGQKKDPKIHRCTHLALYLGERNGEHWVAEAVAGFRRKGEPQVRRMVIQDQRFSLTGKNTYCIFRPKNREIAKESARFGWNYTIKMSPNDRNRDIFLRTSTAYSYLEAMRSLWCSPKLHYFGKQRIFSYYSDYSNRIPFQFFITNKNRFCSDFVFLMTQLAQAKKSPAFQHVISQHPPPTMTYAKYRGIRKLFARLQYAIRREIWAYKMASRYKNLMKKVFTTRLDFLRTSPKTATQYMLDHPEQYKPLFCCGQAQHLLEMQKTPHKERS